MSSPFPHRNKEEAHRNDHPSHSETFWHDFAELSDEDKERAEKSYLAIETVRPDTIGYIAAQNDRLRHEEKLCHTQSVLVLEQLLVRIFNETDDGAGTKSDEELLRTMVQEIHVLKMFYQSMFEEIDYAI